MGIKGDRKGDTTNDHRGEGRRLELKLLAVDRAQELREGEIFWGSSWNNKKGRKEHFINFRS
jgi:hypothetical protein